MKFPLFFILISLSLVGHSETKQPPAPFEPVNLKDSSMSIQGLIKFPTKILKSKEDINVAIRCDAFIERTGKFSSNFCYEEGEKFYPFVTAINRAASSAVVKAGRVNGSARKVYFQYYVVFMKKGEKTSVDVIANSGLDVEKYGFDYTSPQRYREGRGNFGTTCGISEKVTVNAVISEEGAVKSINVVNEEGKTISEEESRCALYLKKTFLQQKYIPAFVNGKPVTAYYSEKVFKTMRYQ
jgi:hypothetical protein